MMFFADGFLQQMMERRVKNFFRSLMSVMLVGLGASPVSAGVYANEEDSIIGENNLEMIEAAIGTEYYEISRSIARMEVGSGYCTGFRIGEDLIMTNHHCMTFKPCQEVRFRFGYEKQLPRPEQVVFKCVKEEIALERLDFAIYRVEEITSSASYPVPVLSISKSAPSQGTPLIMASHAATIEKQIDRSAGCQVMEDEPYTNESRLSFGHGCDSMSGSSGAPILATNPWRIIGIHWGGRGDPPRPLPYNQGIRMVDVLSYVEANAPDLVSEMRLVE
jgi:V8-like Glu-specific endopeptidase